MPRCAHLPDPASNRRIENLFIAAIFGALLLKNIDKQLLGLFKPFLDAELGWSAWQYGLIAGASQLVGAFCLPIAGWAVDLLPLRRTFSAAVGLWSVATLVQAWIASFVSLLIARIVLSASEAFGTPAALRSVTHFLPPARRPRALAIVNMAGSAAAIIAPVMVTLMAAWFGWRSAALVAGVAGFAWLLWWIRMPIPHRRTINLPDAASELPLRHPAAMPLVAAKALSDQLWWVALFWLPDFITALEGGSGSAWGGALAYCYALAALGSLAAAPLLRWRAATFGMGAFASVVLPLGGLASGVWTAASVVGLALFAHQVVSTRIFLAICHDRFSRATGRLAGRAAFAGHLLAFVSLSAVGRAIDSGVSYAVIFGVISAGYMLALAMLHLALHLMQNEG